MFSMLDLCSISSRVQGGAFALLLAPLLVNCAESGARASASPDWSSYRARIGDPLPALSQSGSVPHAAPTLARGMTAAGDSLVSFDGDGLGLAVSARDGEAGRLTIAGASGAIFMPTGAPAYLLAAGPYVDWVHRVSDTIAVLDGARLLLVLDDGARTESLVPLSQIVPSHMLGSSSRLRIVSDGVLLDVQLTSRDASKRDRRFELWHLSKRHARRVFRATLAPLPRSGTSGAAFLGPDEARPMWDGSGDCFFVSDGHRPVVLMGTLADGIVDSLEIPVLPVQLSSQPERSARGAANIADSVLAGLQPPPSLRRRIAAMVLTPEAELWVAPLRAGSSPGRVHLLRVQLATRTVHTDTVVVFPRAFLRSGTVAGVQWERGTQPRFLVAHR